MSDDESTQPRQSTPRVQPTPPGVEPPDATEPSIPGDTGGRVVQPVPPELVDNATFWATGRADAPPGDQGDQTGPSDDAATVIHKSVSAAEPFTAERVPGGADSGAPDQAVWGRSGVQPVPPDSQNAPTAPQEVVIVPSAIPERVDVARQDQAATTPIVPATYAAAPQETTVLRSAVPAQPAGPPGGYQGAATYPGWGAAPPSPSGRSVIPLIALAVVAAMLLGGGVAAWWVTRSQGNDTAVVGDTGANPTNPVASSAPAAPTVSATEPPVTTPTPTATTGPPLTTTAAPPSTATAATAAPTAAPAPSSNTVPGDLGLDAQMRRPPCDGQFIVITANAVTPGRYPDEVSAARRRFVGSAYLRTDQTCSSLRPTDDLGNPIYSVYYGPFPTLARACEIRNQVGGESYVKILDQTTPYTKIWDC